MDIRNDAMMPIRLLRHPLPGNGAFDSAWLNLYDRDDVLGYPIAQEFAAYFGNRHIHRHLFPEWGRDPDVERAPVDEVVAVRHILGFTPFAHTQYWKSAALLDRGAAELKRLLAALN
jgi:hypothetical protein